MNSRPNVCACADAQRGSMSFLTNVYNRAIMLAILGANGQVGGAAARYAASAAIPFRALIRRANTDFADALVLADARDSDAVASSLAGIDALVVSLSGEAIPASATAIVAAAERVGVQRIVVVASAGVLPLPTGGFRCDGPDYPERFRAIGQWHKAAYLSYSASSADWLVVCPPNVRPDVPGECVVEEEALPDGAGQVDVMQLGQTLVDQAVDPSHHRCRLGIVTRPPANATV